MGKINYNPEDLIDHYGIGAVIKNNKGQILLQEHVKFGFWTIPVGKVLKTQTIEEGLKQELLEECDINIHNFKNITNKNFKYNRNGKEVNVYCYIFSIENYSGELKNKEPHKHKTQKFMDIGTIKNLPYLSDLTLLYLETLGIKREAKI